MSEFGEGSMSTTDPEDVRDFSEPEEDLVDVEAAGVPTVLGVYSHPTNKAMDVVQVEVPKGSIVKGQVEITNL